MQPYLLSDRHILFSLSGKHKHQSSKGTLGRTRQKNHPDIMPAHNTVRTVNDTAGTFSMTTSTSLTVAPEVDKREDIFSEQDDANQYHVYNSISDPPSISNQGDPTYSTAWCRTTGALLSHSRT
ncbi:uncharacterized protein LOC116220555 isoform X3 [Clupea harengus]|uniref:Uncharacterized protein LOC116220555 isoform X3 n=1 Tax=Clupea harengus TaxID=7950 RepID=A0A6P8FF46_CLUHA|nr:uncharacterized protein LOC116220555 isoform X3 [Clupea harengus]